MDEWSDEKLSLEIRRIEAEVNSLRLSRDKALSRYKRVQTDGDTTSALLETTKEAGQTAQDELLATIKSCDEMSLKIVHQELDNETQQRKLDKLLQRLRDYDDPSVPSRLTDIEDELAEFEALKLWASQNEEEAETLLNGAAVQQRSEHLAQLQTKISLLQLREQDYQQSTSDGVDDVAQVVVSAAETAAKRREIAALRANNSALKRTIRRLVARHPELKETG